MLNLKKRPLILVAKWPVFVLLFHFKVFRYTTGSSKAVVLICVLMILTRVFAVVYADDWQAAWVSL